MKTQGSGCKIFFPAFGFYLIGYKTTIKLRHSCFVLKWDIKYDNDEIYCQEKYVIRISVLLYEERGIISLTLRTKHYKFAIVEIRNKIYMIWKISYYSY